MIYIAPKKKRIPDAVRREVARRHPTNVARCAYCPNEGTIHWGSRSWVHFRSLELDHVIPEVRGGQGVPENIVLACSACNRRKGHRGGWA